ncbi:ATP-grasp domain-containing protein [Labedaea rhizosphaerae]|uniref:ATP-grasp domain-containing protein n=1 Tax=Labedaea rhizosphaerae TaxID=598644 RepID=A0A4R6RS39_LABRH|nr:ATP-grasp domain-containing protein [Labedaea rhizosphaerae]TDP89065.1 ATP-grasp domain-containing protein [Labedaea rhizosphaerae]
MTWERTAFLVRETRAHWIHDVAAAVHASGSRAVLVTTALDADEQVALASIVDDFLVVPDVRDAEGIAAAVRAHTGGVRPAGLVTGAEGVIATTARAAELLGVARCPADVFTLAHNKFAVREVLAAAGLPTPRYALISDPAQAAAVAEQVGLPAIVKPVNGAASNLIRTVTTVDELADACVLLAKRLPESADARYHRPITGRPGAEPLDPCRTFLVEGLLRGREFALDVAIRDGEVRPAELVDKPLIDERKFELGMCCPPLGLPDERAALIKDAVRDAVLALGLDNTTAHVEVIDDETLGPAIVEVNAGRPGGGAMSVLIKLRTGIDMFAEAVAATLGTPPPELGRGLPIPVGYLVFYAKGSGRLVRVTGTEDIAELPEVVQVVTIVEPGQVLTDEQEIYAVNVFVAGFTDHEELAAIHDEAAGLLEFELEDMS